jgi:hypothetical protein
MNAITVRNLTKRFGGVTAVDDLSFDIDHGTITGFVGPNGVGQDDHAAGHPRSQPGRPRICAHRRPPVRGFLRRHAEDGGSVLVSSHQLAPTSSRPERPPALGGPGKAVGRVAQGFKHALPAGVATLVHDDEIAAGPAVVELPGHIDR